MTKHIMTPVEITVKLMVQHPEDFDIQHIRLAARGSLRNHLAAIENSDNGFDFHPYRANEDVAIILDDVDFA